MASKRGEITRRGNSYLWRRRRWSHLAEIRGLSSSQVGLCLTAKQRIVPSDARTMLLLLLMRGSRSRRPHGRGLNMLLLLSILPLLVE
jgi:hypothetical protein